MKKHSFARGRFSKKKKLAFGFIAGFLALIIGAGFFSFVSIDRKLSRLDNSAATGEALNFDGRLHEETIYKTMEGDIEAASVEEGIRDWAENGGEILSSKNVLNVLIVGYDSRVGEFSGNTDVMMLLSYNKKTNALTLSSFLRDVWVFYETPDGKTGFDKLTALYDKGGYDCLFQGIENHYKISVNRFVAVNFESFQALVDEMGGVIVPVQKYEANYYKTYFGTEIPYGDNAHLTGEQALRFCRIRKCDSDGDVSRARRQQSVIQAILNKVSAASPVDMNRYLNALLPYVTTNFSDKELVSLGVRALAGRWYSLPINRRNVPDAHERIGWSGVWVTDFPLAAQTLQNTLYGMTNIHLPETRTTLTDMFSRP